MGKAIALGIVFAAAAGAIVRFVNAYVGGPSWLVGAVGGAVGSVVCGVSVRASKDK